MLAARRSKRKRFEPEGTKELPLISIINLMVILMPFLLMGASFLEITMVKPELPSSSEPAAQGQAPTAPAPEQKYLNLTVFITREGFTIGGAGGILGTAESKGPTIPLLQGEYDYAQLNQKLFEIRKKVQGQFSDERNVLLVPERGIKYQVIISTMDAAREIWVEEGGQKVKKFLFPHIAIGALSG